MFKSCDSEGKETKVSELQVNMSTVYYDVESILFPTSHFQAWRLWKLRTLYEQNNTRCVRKEQMHTEVQMPDSIQWFPHL